jgi:hypothetical protein
MSSKTAWAGAGSGEVPGRVAAGRHVQSDVVDVTQVVLRSGRDIALVRLEISSTYGSFLEGYPCARVNDRMILGPARQRQQRFGGVPGHVIEPERTYPDPAERPGPWEPVELLPAFTCTGLFRSHPVDPAADTVLNDSRLAVTWFQYDLSTPVAQFVDAALTGADLDWESRRGPGEVAAAGAEPRLDSIRSASPSGTSGNDQIPDLDTFMQAATGDLVLLAGDQAGSKAYEWESHRQRAGGPPPPAAAVRRV